MLSTNVNLISEEAIHEGNLKAAHSISKIEAAFKEKEDQEVKRIHMEVSGVDVEKTHNSIEQSTVSANKNMGQIAVVVAVLPFLLTISSYISTLN